MAHPRRLARCTLQILVVAIATLLAQSSLAKAQDPKPSKVESSALPETVHRVSKGQTLSEIALRYHVTVRALERANGLRSGRLIRAGQRLQVPSPPQAKTAAKSATTAQPKVETKTPSKADTKPALKADAKLAPAPTKAEAKPAAPAKIAQKTAAKPQTVLATVATGSRKATSLEDWKTYRKPAPKPGYVVLRGTAGAYSGFAILKGDRLSPRAYAEFRRVLASWRTGKQVDISERLVRLLVKISDTFGGRPLRIVGGYREHSYAKDSKHCLGHAVDFAVEGVPNTALRDFLRTQARVGVGYYPNSSFVHLDVRKQNAYWIDHAGPGQPPSYWRRPVAPPVNPPPPVNAAPPLSAEAAPPADLQPISVAVLTP